MFGHLRAHLQEQITAAHTSAEQASTARTQAQTDRDQLAERLPPLQDALAQAQATAQEATAALTAAQAVVDQRRQARDDAQAALVNARRALADHAANEPERFDERHHLNPEWVEWKERRDELSASVQHAQAALEDANTLLAQAQQARDAAAERANQAAAAATAAQEQLDAATERVAEAQRRVDAATAAINDAEQAAARLGEQLSKLDARAARVLAEPLDRTDLEHAADAELADLLGRRHERHELFMQRASLNTDRAAVLAAHDQTADAVQLLQRSIGSWPDSGRYPALAGVADALGQVATASMTQRARPPAQRTDDLPAVQAILVEQLGALRAALQQAIVERQFAAAAVAQAAQAMAEHEKAEP